MYNTRTRVHARIPNGHPREEKRASDKTPRTSRRESDRRACPARGKLNGTSRRLLRDDTRTEVGEEVRVGSVEFKLNPPTPRVLSVFQKWRILFLRRIFWPRARGPPRSSGPRFIEPPEPAVSTPLAENFIPSTFDVQRRMNNASIPINVWCRRLAVKCDLNDVC